MKTKFVFIMLALTLSHTVTKAIRGEPLSSCEARAIAKEAYIYGFPLVDSYRFSIPTSSIAVAQNTKRAGRADESTKTPVH
jgi:hypothetical protein